MKIQNKVQNEADAQQQVIESPPKDANENAVYKMPLEYGFKYKGPEPTRYGDWERRGKCVDF